MENSSKTKKQYEPKVKNVPNNEELERNILSIIMNDKDAAQDIFAKVKASDFYSARHQEIYKHLFERNRIGASFDYIGASTSMTEEIKTKIGGLSYLGEVNAASYSSATYEQDVDLLKQLSTLRNVLKITDVVQNRVYNNENSDDIVAYAQGELYNLNSGDEKHELEAVNEGADRVISDIQELYLAGERRTGLSTGFNNLDKIANGGFLPGQMIVLAARPGCGKTSFAMNIVSNVAMKDPNKVIAVFNLEMAKDELIKRMLATYSGVDAKLISSGYNLTEAQMEKLYDAKKNISESKIFLDDSSDVSMNDIHLKVRRLQNKEGRIDLVVIDHMQLIADTNAKGRSRYELMTDISRMVKVMAKDVGVPVIVLSQMSRNFERDEVSTVQGQAPKQRDPKMSDLRESGAIEQDADMILFLTPGDFRVEENETPLNVVVAKNRSGEADVKLNFAWIKSEMRFEPLEHVVQNTDDTKKTKNEDEETEDEGIPANAPDVVLDEPVAPPEDFGYGMESDFLSELRNSAQGGPKNDLDFM